jgi:hypothetical protein
MSTFDLVPSNGIKSFGSKCKVVIDENGTRKLISYVTEVATISEGGTLKITKEESHLTKTTLTHINAFLDFYQIGRMTKKEILER